MTTPASTARSEPPQSPARAEAPLQVVAGAAAAAARCPNCEVPTLGEYCHRCGQKQGPLRVTLRQLLKDVLRYVLRVDSKFLRTAALLFKPGFLTSEYLAGRRERYERPFRLFVVLTVAFYVILALLPTNAIQVRTAEGFEAGGQTARRGDSVTAMTGASPVTVTVSAADGAANAPRFVRRLVELGPAESGARLSAAHHQHGAKLSLAAIPILAAVFSLLYRRRGFMYAEHFIFCLHLQSFATLVSLPGYVSGKSELVQYALLPIFGWMLVAMKRVYGGTWLATLPRFGATVVLTLFIHGLGGFALMLWVLR